MVLDDRKPSYWSRRVSRRRLLGGSAVGLTGLAAAVLVGCGDDEDGESNGGGTPAATTAATSTPGASTSAATPAASERGGSLRVGLATQPSTFDSHFSSPGTDERYLRLVYDPLVFIQRDGSADFDRSVLESFELQDETTLVFRVRDGIQFTNGEVIDAEMVKWNLERQLDPENVAISTQLFSAIDTIEAVDDGTVQLNLSRPYAPILSALGWKGGMVLPRGVVEELGQDDYGRQPIGSGPYKLTSWRDESDLQFERNEDYWLKDAEGRPASYLDDISVRIIPDQTVIVAALQAGEIDYIEEPFRVFQELVDDPNVTTVGNPGAAMVTVYWNHGIAPLNNKLFRRAVSHAWNRDVFNELFYGGLNPPMAGPVPTGSWAYEPQDNFPSYDPEMAKQLLEQSGVPEGERKFNVAGAARVWGGPDAVTLFVDDMAKVGIEVNYLVDRPAGGGPARDGGDGMWASPSGVSLRPDPDVNYSTLYRANAIYNTGYAAVPSLDSALLDAAAATYDQDERKEIYQEVNTILADEIYSVLPGLDRHRWTYVRNDANVQGIQYLWYAPLLRDLWMGA